MKPQIAKRAYELYEARDHKDDSAGQDWEKAEREIRKGKAESETKPEAKAELKPETKAVDPKTEANVEAQPDSKAEPKPEEKDKSQPEAKSEPKPGTEAKQLSDVSPQLIERVHKLYEELGRKDVRAVEDFEKAEREGHKDEPQK
ncbi:MAG: DUF2934 domain-containing protein [Gammaproteobacteria bacterium]